jgi:hypothetical protein
MWEYKYNQEKDETVYYHPNSDPIRLDGQNNKWKDGMPIGKHQKEIKEHIANSSDADRVYMLIDWSLGFTQR